MTKGWHKDFLESGVIRKRSRSVRWGLVGKVSQSEITRWLATQPTILAVCEVTCGTLRLKVSIGCVGAAEMGGVSRSKYQMHLNIFSGSH